MKKEMLINVLQPEECRIAIVEDGVLEELYVERTSQEKLVGNIYKGRIVNIEPSIQAAFVDFGVGRNGFLHVSDVEPQYFTRDGNENGSRYELDEVDAEGDEAPDPDPKPDRRPPRRVPYRGMRSKPPIQEIFKRGQEVLVQVIKEGIGTKGPTLSTYISIPGRYLVLMPGLNRVGVSRKIEDDQQRRQLRDLLKELNPPKGVGFIVRTAGLDRGKRDLQADLAYLTRLWQVVVRRINKSRAPAPIYEESDMITRTIRDTFSNDIDEIWVDESSSFELAREFLQMAMPRYVNRLKLYEEKSPLFHRYGLEDEIARIHQRHVPLPNGGSIVIEQTEALVAIDVNSGNFRADNNAEETAFRMNLAAAKEIARQLRLRDLGGVIVNDFIDMREERHCREVERTLRDAIDRDRARTKILKMSAFGIIEMTRQRIRPSLKRSVYEDCPACHGTGQVKTAESMSIEVVRLLQLAANHPDVSRITVTVQSAVAAYLNNRKRRELTQLEQDGQKTITIRGSEIVPPEHLVFECLDNSGAECKVLNNGAPLRLAAARPPATRPPATRPPVAKPAEQQACGSGAPPEQRPGKRRRRGGRRRGGRGRRRSGAPPVQDGETVVADTSANESAPENELDTESLPFGTGIRDEGLEDRMPDAHNSAPLMQDEPTTEE
jgi:ribonuclease E